MGGGTTSRAAAALTGPLFSRPLGKAYRVDVISAEAVDRAVAQIVADFNGRLDVVVANSGIAWAEGDFIDAPADAARRVMAVNVDGVMWCARSAGAHFRRQKKEGTTLDGRPLDGFAAGSFIATASVSGSVVNVPQAQAVYNASKAAVIQFCARPHRAARRGRLTRAPRQEPSGRVDGLCARQHRLARLHPHRDARPCAARHGQGVAGPDAHGVSGPAARRRARGDG